MKSFTELLEEYKESGTKSLGHLFTGNVLGWYVKHPKTKEISIHKTKNDAENRAKEINKKHNIKTAQAAVYWDNPDRNSLSSTKKAYDMHMKSVNEEVSEDEFNDEVEENKDKNSGKIRNKKIASAAIQSVEIQKEDIEELDERELSPDELKEREKIVKKLKGKKESFKKLYGDRAKEVMYATATKIAKEDIDDFGELTEEQLEEWNASGHTMAKAAKWLNNNGFEFHRHGAHPVYKHKITGKTITAFNVHGKEASAQSLRNTRAQIINHHKQNNIKYIEI